MQIRRVKIKRYRGVESLAWHPTAGVNCLIGPGDVGKSTVLDAIATVLTAAPGRVASEHDYFQGDTSAGFTIELMVGALDDEILRAWQVPPLWTWLPASLRAQADPDPLGEGVLCLRARGTDDLEIEHVVIDPSDGEIPLSPSKRQKFGLSTMGSAVTAYRELRMSRGSLLSRNLGPEQLRGLVTEALQATRDNFHPSSEVSARLKQLSESLERIAPGTGELALAVLAPRGQNLLGMIGLFARRDQFAVPLANAGLGTQQLALFTLAQLLIDGLTPLFVIDEIESGLEPFRQRDLVARIRKAIGKDGQAFITSHSPAVVGELKIEELHRLEAAPGECRVVALPVGLDRLHRDDAEALLSRLAVLVEGLTELGLLEVLLECEAAMRKTSIGAVGIRLVDGEGQPSVFKVTAALTAAKQRFGAFLDTESVHQGKRDELVAADHVAFGTYTNARCLEEALSKQLSIDHLEELINLPGPAGHDLSTSRYQQLNHVAGKPGRQTLKAIVDEQSDRRARELFSEAANQGRWFKSRADGRAVAAFLVERSPDCPIVRDARAFWDSALKLIAAEMPADWQMDGRSEP
jgi:putative ATP-dependent endonuclease of OLD family